MAIVARRRWSAPVTGAAHRHPRDPPLRPVVAARAHRRHHRPRPGARRHRPRSSASRSAPTRSSATSRRRSRQLLRPAVPDPRRPPPDARRRADRARRARAGSCCAPTPAARCGRPPRTRTAPCCSASRCGGCRRSCGRSPAASPTITFITKAPFTGVVPEALVGATDDPPRPGRRRRSPGSSRCPSRCSAGIGLGIAEWTIRWNVDRRVGLRRHVPRRDPRGAARPTGPHEPGRDRRERAGTAPACSSRSPRSCATLPEVRWPAPGHRRSSAPSSSSSSPLDDGAVAPSRTLSFAVVWAMVAMSLVVLTGWGGNVSLGQFAIVGVGAMAAGNLLMRWNVDLVRRRGRRHASSARSSRWPSACPRCASAASTWRSRRSPSPSPSTPTSSTRSTSRASCPTAIVAPGAVEAVRPGERVGHATTSASPWSAARRRWWCGPSAGPDPAG